MLQVNFQPFPDLYTNRLLLKQVTTNDVHEVFALRSNKTLMRFINRPLAQTEEDALSYIETLQTALTKNDGITWGVTLKYSNAVIGTIGLWRLIKEHFRAEIGYMIDEAHQGTGLMREAIEAVLRYGFDVMKLH